MTEYRPRGFAFGATVDDSRMNKIEAGDTPAVPVKGHIGKVDEKTMLRRCRSLESLLTSGMLLTTRMLLTAGMLVMPTGVHATAQSNYFGKWPAGTSPQEIGKRVAEKLGLTSHPTSNFARGEMETVKQPSPST